MATLAQIFDRFGANRPAEEMPRVPARNPIEAYRLRALPNEDVYLFVKKIDNSRVVRESDPKSRRACWRAIGASCGIAVTITIVLLPSVSSLLAGYRIETLRAERQHLQVERAALELEETKLLSPARLEELARMQQFVDPSPQKVIYLDGSTQGTMAKALNVHATSEMKQ